MWFAWFFTRWFWSLSITAVVLVATGGYQGLEYWEVYKATNQAYHKAIVEDKDCLGTKENFPNAYNPITCGLANLTAQKSPALVALKQLAKRTWPHSDNLIALVETLWNWWWTSTPAYFLMLAAGILFWPRIQRIISFCGETINMGKVRKGEKELERLADAIVYKVKQQQQYNLTPLPVSKGQ